MAELSDRKKLELLRAWRNKGNERAGLEYLRATQEMEPETGYQQIKRQQQEYETVTEAEEQKRQANISELLGGDYDPTDTFPQTPGDWWNVFDLGRTEEFSVQQRKFLSKYPKGKLLSVLQPDDSYALVGKKGLGDPLRELPSGVLATGTIVSEPLLGGLIGSFARGGVFAGPLGTAVGTAVGGLAQVGIESLRGFGVEREDWFNATMIEAGMAGSLDFVGRGVAKLAFGSGARKAYKDAVLAAKVVGLEPLSVGQVSKFKIVRELFVQVGKIGSRFEAKKLKERQSLLAAFGRLSETRGAGISDDALQRVVVAQNEELAVILHDPINLTKASVREAFVQGTKVAVRAGRAHISRLYNKAIKLSDDVVFNLGTAKDHAANFRVGVWDRDALGNVIPLEGKLAPEIESVIDDIMKLPSRITSTKGGFTSFEKIKALRTRLYNLKEILKGHDRGVAKRLWKQLTRVMDNPISGDPEFVSAWKAASMAHHVFEDNISKLGIMRLLSRRATWDSQQEAAAKFLRPDNVESLGIIRAALPEKSWDAFRSGYALRLAAEPKALTALNQLENFAEIDQRGLRMLMSPQEEVVLRNGLKQKIAYQNSPVREALRKNMTEAETKVHMIKSGTAQDTDDFVRLAGGRDSEGARDLVAGVYRDILDNATSVSGENKEILLESLILQGIDKWQKSGKLVNLFTPHDWKVIKGIRAYSTVFEAADVGGGMMAGAYRQQLVAIPGQIMKGDWKGVMRTAHKGVANMTYAWALARPALVHRVTGQPGIANTLGRIAATHAIIQEEFRKRERGAKKSGGPKVVEELLELMD